MKNYSFILFAILGAVLTILVVNFFKEEDKIINRFFPIKKIEKVTEEKIKQEYVEVLKTKTDTVIFETSDTLILGDTMVVMNYPTYKTLKKDQWSEFEIIASKDSTQLNYKMFNELKYRVELEKNGFFKPNYYNITFENTNPNLKNEKKEIKIITKKKNGILKTILTFLAFVIGLIAI